MFAQPCMFKSLNGPWECPCTYPSWPHSSTFTKPMPPWPFSSGPSETAIFCSLFSLAAKVICNFAGHHFSIPKNRSPGWAKVSFRRQGTHARTHARVAKTVFRISYNVFLSSRSCDENSNDEKNKKKGGFHNGVGLAREWRTCSKRLRSYMKSDWLRLELHVQYNEHLCSRTSLSKQKQGDSNWVSQEQDSGISQYQIS